jgi:hypothetical protein
MPCYTVTTIKTDVGKWNVDRWNIVKKQFSSELRDVEYSNGQLITRAYSANSNDLLIKTASRLYAAQTIRDASKRFGWRVAGDSTTATGNIQLQLRR